MNCYSNLNRHQSYEPGMDWKMRVIKIYEVNER